MKTILFRAALLVASFLVTFGLIEAAIRYIDKGGLPSLPIFTQLDSGLIVLKDDVAVWHSRQDGSVYSLTTARLGLRRSPPNDIRSTAEWLAVGDSQVLGLGVVDTATFSAIVTARGFRMANAGVPGYGVEDALEHAAFLLPLLKPKGVLVAVNQANDWEEVGHLASERLRVRGSWLLQPEDATGWVGAFMATPLSRSHFLFYTAQILHFAVNARRPSPEPPAWLANPGGEEPTTARMAAAIKAFARLHSEVRTIVCFVPVDVATSRDRVGNSPFRALIRDQQPWQSQDLRDQLASQLAGIEWVDLLPALKNHPDAFLDGDYHLSETGHALAADMIVRSIVDPSRAK